MLSLTLQLLHFSSSFLTTINSYLYMLSLYRLCSTKQQKCNLLLKFQSNFRVDKVTYNIIILRSLLFMHYCLQLFFFNAMYHYPCLTICVHPLLPISPFRKVRSFPLMLTSWRISRTPSWGGLQFYIFGYGLSPRRESDLFNFQSFLLSYTTFTSNVPWGPHIIYNTLFFFHLSHLLHAFKWAIPPRTSAHPNLRQQNHLELVF